MYLLVIEDYVKTKKKKICDFGMKTCSFTLPRSRDRIVLYQRMNQKQLLTFQVDRKIKGEKISFLPRSIDLITSTFPMFYTPFERNSF